MHAALPLPLCLLPSADSPSWLSCASNFSLAPLCRGHGWGGSRQCIIKQLQERWVNDWVGPLYRYNVTIVVTTAAVGIFTIFACSSCCCCCCCCISFRDVAIILDLCGMQIFSVFLQLIAALEGRRLYEREREREGPLKRGRRSSQKCKFRREDRKRGEKPINRANSGPQTNFQLQQKFQKKKNDNNRHKYFHQQQLPSAQTAKA